MLCQEFEFLSDGALAGSSVWQDTRLQTMKDVTPLVIPTWPKCLEGLPGPATVTLQMLALVWAGVRQLLCHRDQRRICSGRCGAWKPGRSPLPQLSCRFPREPTALARLPSLHRDSWSFTSDTKKQLLSKTTKPTWPRVSKFPFSDSKMYNNLKIFLLTRLKTK